MTESSKSKDMNRRKFLGSASLTGVGVTLMSSKLVRGTATNSDLSVGLLGCGGRGRAVSTALLRNTDSRMTALADLFSDQLEKAHDYYGEIAAEKGQAKVDSNLLFQGPEAYQEIANCSRLDALILATPDYFHPLHLEAVVDAGKHVYCEKPAGVDVVGAKKFIELGEKARGRMSLVVGFNVRTAPPIAEIVRRIHAGDIGKIAAASTYYHATSINYPPRPNASPLERRIRNWYWDKVLTGDIIVDQNIHVIDLCNWVLGSPPVKAIGTGGRSLRQDNGDCWDHFDVVYTYPGDVHVSFNSIQHGEDPNVWDVAERFFGSKGAAEAHYKGPVRIYGENAWSWQSSTAPSESGDQNATFSTTGEFTDNLAEATPEKVKEFHQSVIRGRYLNQAEEAAESALAAMLGRQAAYTGEEVTWEQFLKSDQEYDAGIDWSEL